MTAPEFYRREGLNVLTYDAVTPEDMRQTAVEGDVEFFIDQARATGGPVLELACGTGRVAWSMAEAGYETVGVDISPPMLARAEAKRHRHPRDVARRMTFAQGSLTTFQLHDSFALVLIPFRSFQVLLDPGEQRRCLDRVFRHLLPGGRLIIDLFDPRLEWCLPQTAAPAEPTTVFHPGSGNPVTIDIIHHSNDPLRQRLEEHWEFVERDMHGTLVRREVEILRMRWTYRWEMHYLLQLAGFEVLEELSDFRGRPPAYGGEQIWVARRP